MKYSNSYRIMLYILLFAAGQMPNVPPISRSTLNVPEVPELELDCGGEGKLSEDVCLRVPGRKSISFFLTHYVWAPKNDTCTYMFLQMVTFPQKIL